MNISPQEAENNKLVAAKTTVKTVEVEKPKPKKEIVQKKKATPTVSEKPSFIVVIGAYGNLEYANIAIKKLSKSGYTPDLGKSGNLHQVGIQLFCTEAELSAKVKAIRKEYKNAWVLR